MVANKYWALNAAVEPTDAAADGSSSVWYLQRARAGSLQQGVDRIFDFEGYRRRLVTSALKPKVIRTLEATAGTASARGTTSVDRMTIAKLVGRDESTITQHWKLARGAGLMKSTRRWNTSSVHDFTVDGASVIDHDVRDLAPHAWTADEQVWWNAPNYGSSLTPWGDGPSPF